ncbi:MAG TPA: hypothetical protein PKV72_05780 [Candidatus Peribacteria bacterium]|nr:hypothetical protein [Candidatus Peribacteria bacterium]
MLQSTGALLSETWSFLIVRWKSVGIGIVAFTMVLAVNQAFFARQIDRNIAGILTATGLTNEEFQADLTNMLQNGAPADEVDRIIESLRQSVSTGRPAEEFGFVPTKTNAGLYFVISSMPLVFGLMLIAVAILYVSGIFFTLMAVQDGRGTDEIARQLPAKILFVSLLLPWIFFRSMAWIPLLVCTLMALLGPPMLFLPMLFIGLVLAATLTSRYMLAPVLLLAGQQGVRQSAKVSYAKTKGMLMAILGSRLTLVVFITLVIWVASGFVDILSSFVPKAGFLLWLLVVEVCVAYGAVFNVRLAKAVLLKGR